MEANTYATLSLSVTVYVGSTVQHKRRTGLSEPNSKGSNKILYPLVVEESVSSVPTVMVARPDLGAPRRDVGVRAAYGRRDGTDDVRVFVVTWWVRVVGVGGLSRIRGLRQHCHRRQHHRYQQQRGEPDAAPGMRPG